MNAIQAKIGKVCSAFSLFVFCLNLFGVITGGGNNKYTVVEISSFMLYAILFFITAFVINNYIRVLQVLLMLSISVYMAFYSSDFPSFIILFVCISLCYVYGFYNKHKLFRGIISFLVIVSIFYLCPSNNHNILSTLSWTALFATFVLMVWFIFSDSLERAKKEPTKDKLLEELKRSLVINERLIQLTKEMAEKIEGQSHGI